MLVFYFFAAIAIILGVLSLRSGIYFARYLRQQLAAKSPDFLPFVSVIAPCRGNEEGLNDNLRALLVQDYPNYEIVFVTDSPEDQSVPVIKLASEREGKSARDTRIVIAGPAVSNGQKVHNLQVAVGEVDPRSEVLVFVDSDARPKSGWLKALVAPLADESLGASTGYRWFIPANGNFASHLRSVWNASIASALGPNREKNFCWGGSTAIRRTTFDELGVAQAWSGTVSDDFALTSLLQAAKRQIHFVPQCLVPSVGPSTLSELVEFSNRQLKITRVYAPHLWTPLLIGSLLFVAVFFGGILLVVTRFVLGLEVWIAALMLALIFALGSAKSLLRWRAVAEAIGPASRTKFSPAAHLLLWPVASALFLWNAVAAAWSRQIEWRGITYELKSASEAVIIRRT